MKSSNILNFAKYQYFVNMIIVALNALILILIIRYFSIPDYGTYSYILSFGTIFSLLANFGFPGLLQKYIPTLTNADSNLLINQLFYIQSIMLFFILVGFYILNNYFLLVENYIFIIVIYFYFVTINGLIFRSYLSVRLEFSFMYKILLFLSLVKLLSIYLLYSYNVLTIQNIFYVLLSYEIFLYFITFFFKIKIKKYNSYLNKQNLYKDSIPFLKESIFSMLMSVSAGIWFLKSYYNIEYVAHYTFAVSMSLFIANNISLLNRLEIIINNLFLRTKEDIEEKFILTLWYKAFLFVSIPVIMFLFVFQDDISFLIFNDKYINQMIHLNVLIVLLFASHFSYLYTPIIYKKDDLHSFAEYAFFSSIVNVVLIIILGVMFGYIGCIYAMGLAYISKVLYLINKYGIVIHMQETFIFFLKIIIISISVAFVIKKLIISSSLFFLSLGLYILVVLVMMYIIKPFSLKEKTIIEESFTS